MSDASVPDVDVGPASASAPDHIDVRFSLAEVEAVAAAEQRVRSIATSAIEARGLKGATVTQDLRDPQGRLVGLRVTLGGAS